MNRRIMLPQSSHHRPEKRVTQMCYSSYHTLCSLSICCFSGNIKDYFQAQWGPFYRMLVPSVAMVTAIAVLLLFVLK